MCRDRQSFPSLLLGFVFLQAPACTLPRLCVPEASHVEDTVSGLGHGVQRPAWSLKVWGSSPGLRSETLNRKDCDSLKHCELVDTSHATCVLTCAPLVPANPASWGGATRSGPCQGSTRALGPSARGLVLSGSSWYSVVLSGPGSSSLW